MVFHTSDTFFMHAAQYHCTTFQEGSSLRCPITEKVFTGINLGFQLHFQPQQQCLVLTWHLCMSWELYVTELLELSQRNFYNFCYMNFNESTF